MEGTMKAAVFRGVENIQLEERPIPPCPEDGLLVKVHFCGICGGDVRNYSNGLKGGVVDRVMGHEIAGEVMEAGAKAGLFKVGDRVALAPDVSCGECWYCKRGLVNLCLNHKMLGTHYDGGFAQYLALPGEVLRRGFVEPIPEGMPYPHAAFAETASAVIACQKRIGVTLGTRMVIVGDGPVGCLHVEVARAMGAGQIIMVGMDKLELAKAFAPDILIKNDDAAKTVQTVLNATGGIGADVVMLAVPTAKVQQQGVEMARKRGTVVIYGGVPKTAEESQLNSNTIHYNEITVTGAFSYGATGLSDALDAIHAGQVSPEKYIGATVPLSGLEEGIGMSRRGEALKVMVDPWLDA